MKAKDYPTLEKTDLFEFCYETFILLMEEFKTIQKQRNIKLMSSMVSLAKEIIQKSDAISSYWNLNHFFVNDSCKNGWFMILFKCIAKQDEHNKLVYNAWCEMLNLKNEKI